MLRNLEKASNYQVHKWFEENIVNLTQYQKEKMRDDEIFKFCPFQFYVEKKSSSSFLYRLSTPLFCLVWVLLACSLPINFIITGNFGYKNLNWFEKWLNLIHG